jgi:hypothetical protein
MVKENILILHLYRISNKGFTFVWFT